jgi:hypothetical protein
MKKLLLIVAWLVAVFGAGLVAFVALEFLTSSLDAKGKMPGLIQAIPLLCVGSGLLVIALQFIRKKNPESSVFLSQGAGLIAWGGTREITRSLIHSDGPVAAIAALGIPVLVGIAVYQVLLRSSVAKSHANETRA